MQMKMSNFDEKPINMNEITLSKLFLQISNNKTMKIFVINPYFLF